MNVIYTEWYEARILAISHKHLSNSSKQIYPFNFSYDKNLLFTQSNYADQLKEIFVRIRSTA